MQVRDVVKGKGREVISIGPEATVADAMARMVENNIGSLPVADPDGRLLGIISERDVLRLIRERGAASGDAKIADVMTRDPICCDMDHDVEEVMGKMSEHRIAKLPVLCESKLCGIVSVGDVVRVLYDRARSENQQLLDYIHSGR
jgi:CBS domain-containing protein